MTICMTPFRSLALVRRIGSMASPRLYDANPLARSPCAALGQRHLLWVLVLATGTMYDANPLARTPCAALGQWHLARLYDAYPLARTPCAAWVNGILHACAAEFALCLRYFLDSF